MSDIIERLRRGEPCLEASSDNACRVKDAASGCLCAMAADTIQTLAAKYDDAMKRIQDLEAELEYLRREVNR